MKHCPNCNKKILAQIKRLVENRQYEYIGIRMVTPNYDEYELSIGSYTPDSHEWYEGDPTNDMCNGTCAIDVRSTLPTCKQLDDFLAKGEYTVGRTTYCANRIFVLEGGSGSYGEDNKEIIIRNAKIIHIFYSDVDYNHGGVK